MSTSFTINPKLDFALERFIDAPTSLVWDALTKPEHVTAPEPGTILLLATGLLGIAGAARRRRGRVER